LDLGDDIITEYFYYDNNDPNTGNLVYLQTAGSNDLVKTKYWDQYLNNTSNSDRYPVLPPASPVFEVPIAGLSTSTNPNTGGTVNTGWLGPVYGKDLYVRVTLVHNGNVSIETQSVAIPAPEAICQATTVSLDASGQLYPWQPAKWTMAVRQLLPLPFPFPPTLSTATRSEPKP
jgi:hypothetical protein